MSIQIRNITKTFGTFRALKGVNFDINPGELVALLGPSGCGKTTLLRIIAGLDWPDAGQILFHGEDATSRHVREREVGFVFQHYALFRHMTVFENIAFGLRVRPKSTRPADGEIKEKVLRLLKLVQLEWLAERYPPQLSGGQRQRIALARALAVEPKVLLLDEPFGALDAKVRKDLRRWLRNLHDELHVTSVFVTHDQEEALEVADRIVVMNEGQVEQIGAPDDVYEHPASPFVFQFLGDVNLFHGRVDQGWAKIGEADIHLPEQAVDQTQSEQALFFVRPHEIEVTRSNGQIVQGIAAHVRDIRRYGAVVRLELERTDGQGYVEAVLSRDEFKVNTVAKGDEVILQPKRIKVFPQVAPVDAPQIDYVI